MVRQQEDYISSHICDDRRSAMKAIRLQTFGEPEEIPLAEAAKAHYAVIESLAYDKIVLIP
jgi:hypothetical protein